MKFRAHRMIETHSSDEMKQIVTTSCIIVGKKTEDAARDRLLTERWAIESPCYSQVIQVYPGARSKGWSRSTR